MSFDPKNFLAFAETTYNTAAPADAAHRTAVSRSYYAVYLTFKRVLEPLGADLGPGGHSGLVRGLKRTRIRHLRKIKEMLEILRENRERADYDLEIVVVEAEAEDAINRASNALRSLGAVPENNLRSLAKFCN